MEESIHEEYIKLEEPVGALEPQSNREGVAQGQQDYCDDANSGSIDCYVGVRWK